MWVSITGLCANLLGVLIIAIPTTRFVSSPLLGRVGNSNQLKDAKKELYSERNIEKNDKYFDIIMSFIPDECSEFEENQSLYKITSKSRLDGGTTVAVHYKEDEVERKNILAPVAVFDNWIENRIERAYLKVGLVFVALGFFLQLISYIIV